MIRRASHVSHLCRAAALILTLAPLAMAPAGVSAGALTLGFLAHGHQLSLSGDVGHVDLVLHHRSESEADTRDLGLGRPAIERHDDDHVVHLAAAESTRVGAKRAPAPFGAVALPSPAGVALRFVTTPNRPLILARGRPAALLRTIVLRV